MAARSFAPAHARKQRRRLEFHQTAEKFEQKI